MAGKLPWMGADIYFGNNYLVIYPFTCARAGVFRGVSDNVVCLHTDPANKRHSHMRKLDWKSS